jgi:MFS family permease
VTDPLDTTARDRIIAPAYLATTIGAFALIAFNAFEELAVTTVMPTISRSLHGFDLYAAAFAAPLASSVVGMVAAGLWSDRRSPAGPVVASLGIFTLGMLACGLAPTMAVFVAGRVVQGLGTGALIVSLYVVVGLVYPGRLQPAIFAVFSAAWVLPSLFGPPLAALVARTVGWRWIFLGVIALVAVAAVLVVPALRRLRTREDAPPTASLARLAWSAVAAVAVLGVELLSPALALLAAAVAVAAIRQLLPRHTLLAGRGLPAVIGTRGTMSAAFFCGQAYVVLALQDRWEVTPGRAGIALTVVGVIWASASQVQARLGERLSHTRAMHVSAAMLLGASVLLWVTVWQDWGPWVMGLGFAVSGAGMGLGFPRTSVATLAASTDDDRGFNSSALSIGDAIGAALALSVCGLAYESAVEAGGDPFLAVFGVAIVAAIAAIFTAYRTE